MSDPEYTHWLRPLYRDNLPWEKVTKAEWIKAERAAGFRPKMSSDDPAYMDTYATGGFGNGQISGALTVDDQKPKW